MDHRSNVMANSAVVVLLFMIVALSQCDSQQQTAFQCGVPKVKINEAIMRGRAAAEGTWPWHAAIMHRDGRSVSYGCGGTLISERFVVTAAHCVIARNGYVMSTDRIHVKLGAHDLHEPNMAALQVHQVQKILLFATTMQLKNDIAIIALSTLARFTNYVQPVCINQEQDLKGQVGTVPGWGITETGELSSVLMVAELEVIDVTECLASNRDLFGQTLDRTLFCAGHTNGTGVCNGDSGGGLVFRKGDAWYFGGIVSFTALREDGTNRCQTEGYAAFTSVAFYVDWLRNVTNQPPLEDSGDDIVEVKYGKDAKPRKRLRNYFPRHCGSYIINRITGGRNADLFEFPWMAVLRSKIIDENRHLSVGSGTLINKRFVLTSANAFKNSYYNIVLVRLGEYDTTREIDCNVNDPEDCAPPVQDYGIEYAIVHQNYSSFRKQNDIALVRLNKEVDWNDHIQPICLPINGVEFQTYIITGWGETSMYGNRTTKLQKARVPRAPPSECSKFDNDRIVYDADSQLCIGGEGTADTCRGDGGAPLGQVTKYNGVLRFVQYGITSYGSKDCGTTQSVYTKVAHFIRWIAANMESE